MRRARGAARIALLFLAGAASPSVPATAAAADPDSAAASLEDRIDALRGEARYADAAAAAETLLAARRGGGAAEPAADAERLVATLRFASGLDAADRARLAEADRAAAQIEERFQRGEYAEAAALAETQLATRSAILGDRHEEVARALNDLAALRRRLGAYAEAESLFTRALAIQRACLPEDHRAIGVTLNNAAALHWELGRYRAAEEEWSRALAIRRKSVPRDDLALARTAQNLAMAIEAQGDRAEAESLLRESLAIKKPILGERDPSYLRTLANLAYLLDSAGEPSQAEALYRQILATLHDLYGEERAEVADAREQLGMHLAEQGDCESARDLVEEALAVKQRLLGPDDRTVAVAMGNLASILVECGDPVESERLLREANRILEARLGADHPSSVRSLSALGIFEDRRHADAQSEPLFASVLEQSRRIYAADHPEVARAALNLAISLRKQGKLDAAAPLMEEAIAIRRRALGERHPALASALRHAGLLWLVRGELDRAAGTLTEASEIFESARLRTDPGLERVTFLDSPYALLGAVELLRGRSDAAWPSAEKDRGRALAELLLAADRRELSAKERAGARALTRELADREREFAALKAPPKDASAPAGAGALAERRARAHSLLLDTEARWAAFQREIALRHPVSEGQVYPLERVQRALAANTALIGWLDAPVANDSCLAWAYVVRRGEVVRWARVDALGADDTSRPEWLERAVAALRDPNSDRTAVSDDARRLWSARVAPIESALEGITELVVIPAGPTAALPLESFIDSAGAFLGERFAISYAPSATVFAWLHENASARAPWRRSLLVGDPPFRAEAAGREVAADASAAAKPWRPSESLVRDARKSAGATIASLPRLPGTRVEVAAIDSVLAAMAALRGGRGAAATERATVLVGAAACEDEIVRLAESGGLADFDVIHFATHALIDERRPERSALVLAQDRTADPLAAALDGRRTFDGLVTAKEVLRDWRLDADLVVLSACESGVGREVRGEGTVGFAHAFFQAGVRSVVVSLWRVDDRATALFMRRFYENCTGVSARPGAPGVAMPKAEALREAKRWLREYRTPSGRQPYAHPYYWSSFILVGDRG
ncbi:MAG: CHAT domain-containing protein [bacterium]